jgi:hypothetical protein
MSAAVRGIAPILEPCGRLWLAVVHPINSAERFETDAADAPFVIKRDYLSAFTYADMVERDGLSMTFHRLRPIESYFWRLRGQAYSSKLSESQAFRATRKSVRPANFCHPNKRDQRKQGRRGNWVGAFRAQLPCGGGRTRPRQRWPRRSAWRPLKGGHRSSGSNLTLPSKPRSIRQCGIG